MKNVNKKELFIKLIPLFITLLSCIILVSYAYYKIKLEGQKTHFVSTDVISFTYKESEDKISITNMEPKSDAEGIKENYFEFNVASNLVKDISINYEISILKTSTTNSFEENDVKAYLTDGNDNALVNPILISNLGNSKKIANAKVIYNNSFMYNNSNEIQTHTYRLRVWLKSDINMSKYTVKQEIDDSKTNISLTGCTFKFKVNVSTVEQNLDTSGANKPVLASNMIPVYYDEANSVWKKADKNNSQKDYRWYSYSSTGEYKGMWANAVTVKDTNRQTYLNATPGTTISMDDITTMWVWIPRFNAVTPSNYNGGTQAKPNAIDVTFVKQNETAIDAFTFGNKELSGFWYGKFEIGGSLASSCTNETCNVSNIVVKPNVSSLRSQKVSSYFFASRSMEQPNNSFGFINSEVDTHMSKNNEWGAVAYLTQSIYGRCTSSTTCTEVYINNSEGYYTGRSGDTPSDSNYTNAGTYEYNQNKVESTLVEGTGTNITPKITNDTTYPWANNNGVYSSGNKGKDSTTSTLTYTFTLTDKGAVLFDYSVSSEKNYDKMKYTINKDSTTIVTGTEISGTSRGTTESSLQYENKVHVLEKGTYTLVFTYSKDSSGNTGLDKGYVKNVKVLNGVQTIDKVLPGGQNASTTGTIYGIYDMSGGAGEYVMGVLADTNGKPRSGYNSSSNSGFTGMLYEGTTYTGVSFPDSKYYNLYTGSSYTGHALTETARWYSDTSGSVGTNAPWFIRSGNYFNSMNAGVFFNNSGNGGSFSIASSRLVISNE